METSWKSLQDCESGLVVLAELFTLLLFRSGSTLSNFLELLLHFQGHLGSILEEISSDLLFCLPRLSVDQLFEAIFSDVSILLFCFDDLVL